MRACLVLGFAACFALQAEDITPRVGDIEIYGARKVPLKKIRSAIGAKEGDVLPAREDVEERIDKISGIVASRVEAACCDGRKMILYVGVEEKTTPHFEFHPAPAGDVTLPADLEGNYRTFLDEVGASLHAHNADEDLTNGYSLMADPACRELQQTFIPFVAQDLALIDRVVRESADPEQRATAAYLLQYGPRTPRAAKTIVDGLQYALQDPEDTVRENAMRALQAVAVGAKLHPEEEIHIEPTWFVELMNSIVWSDRHNASLALVNLTQQRDPETLALIRERALWSVIEIACWRDMEHALPGFILAGRLAGLDEKQIQDAWVSGNRLWVLKAAWKPKGKIIRAKK
ncbi:MAG: hypothetical protein WB992_02205 [Bryobacteraceae bacterium]